MNLTSAIIFLMGVFGIYSMPCKNVVEYFGNLGKIIKNESECDVYRTGNLNYSYKSL